MVVDVCQMYSPKFLNNILDMESQMNGIAVIRPSFFLLDTLIDNLSALSHSVNFANSQFNVAIIVFIFVPSIRTVVSSANSMENKFSDTLAKSLIYKINNKGPSMDPCGTTCVIGMVADKVSL